MARSCPTPRLSWVVYVLKKWYIQIPFQLDTKGWKKRGFLEQAVDLPGFGVDVHIKVPRCGGQTRDRLDVGSQSVAGYTLAQFSIVKETSQGK